MSLESVLEILAERGLSVQVSADGKPSLHGPREEATPLLLDAVKAYKAEIVERFRPPRLKEFLWATGYKAIQYPECDLAAIPTGAWWWRWQDESEWQAIPDRPGVGVQPPEAKA